MKRQSGKGPRRPGTLFLALALAGAWPVLAWSHAYPKMETPAPSAKLQHAPSVVKILFTEDLEPAFSHIKVTNSQGNSVVKGHSDAKSGKPRLLVAPLKTIQSGTYTVHWHVVARDGHTTHGQYTFRVLPPSGN
jgi:methionine-rich copper-binding protein CopC